MPRRLALIAATLFAATTPALALDMPPRKAGLWELKMDFERGQMPATVMKHCIDAASDKLMNSQFGGATQESCSRQDMKTSGNTITIDSVCKFSDATTTSHAVVTGSFDSAYTVNVTSTREGGRPLPGQTPSAATHMKIDAKWLGPCTVGMKPGDILMPNGMKMNILDMPKLGVAPKQ